MQIVNGVYNKELNYYKMHRPAFPYETIVYMGYTLEAMKRAYRNDNGLKHKRITWNIL